MRGDQPRDISRTELGTLGGVTLALAAVLLTPLVPALDSAGPAQAAQAANDAARSTASQLRREIATAAGIIEPDGRYLNLSVRGNNGSHVVRAEQAVLDIVPPRPRKDGPAGRAQAVPALPGVEQPLAPEMTVVRFFVGLRYPIDARAVPGRPELDEPQPYVNRFEGVTDTRGDSDVARQAVNNPYVLYRANFTPYRLKKKGERGYRGPNRPAYAVNDDLFAADDQGKPILDDPDFFRVVTTDDRNPSTKRPYSASEATAHDIRVTHWVTLAKSVLSDLDLDVLRSPRDGTGALTVAFSPRVARDAATPSVPGRLLFYTTGTVQVGLGLRVYDDKSGRGETARRDERVDIGGDRPPA